MATSASTLIGITTLLAGGVVEGALRYSNVIPLRHIPSLFVVPGLYTVSVRLLKRCNSRVALMFSPGDRENRRKILGFEVNGLYKYIGIHSGTHAVVLNPLFESWLNAINRNAAEAAVNSKMIRNNGYCVLGKAKCSVKPNKDAVVRVLEPTYLLCAFVLQLGAFATFVFMVLKGDAAGIIINAANMLVYYTITAIVSRERTIVPLPKITPDVPPGDMIVTDRYNNKLWIITGDENTVQSVAQKEIISERGCSDNYEVIACVFGIITAVATILVVPIMSNKARTYFTIQLGIGLVSSMLFSSRDGEKMLTNIFEEHYYIKPIITKYTNRATAVAAAVLHSKADPAKVYGNILPFTEHYATYRNLLRFINAMPTQEFNSLKDDVSSILNRTCVVNDHLAIIAGKFAEILPETENLLHISDQDIGKWPARLMADVAEAFVEEYT